MCLLLKGHNKHDTAITAARMFLIKALIKARISLAWINLWYYYGKLSKQSLSQKKIQMDSIQEKYVKVSCPVHSTVIYQSTKVWDCSVVIMGFKQKCHICCAIQLLTST